MRRKHYTFIVRPSDWAELKRVAKRLSEKKGRFVPVSDLISYILELPDEEWERWTSLAPQNHTEELKHIGIYLSERDRKTLRMWRLAYNLPYWKIFAIFAHGQFLSWADGKLF